MNRKILYIVLGVVALCLVFAACWDEFFFNGHDAYKNAGGSLINGTETGTGEGFNGSTIKVKITVANGYIDKVDITSSTGEYGAEGKKAMADAQTLIKAQNSFDFQVDALGVATRTVKGIIDGGKDALDKLGAEFDY